MRITKDNKDEVFIRRGWAMQSCMDAIPHLKTNVRGFITDTKCETKEAKKLKTKPVLREEDLHDWMTVDELAGFMRMNIKTLYEQIALGKIPGVKHISLRGLRISKKKLINWLNE